MFVRLRRALIITSPQELRNDLRAALVTASQAPQIAEDRRGHGCCAGEALHKMYGNAGESCIVSILGEGFGPNILKLRAATEVLYAITQHHN